MDNETYEKLSSKFEALNFNVLFFLVFFFLLIEDIYAYIIAQPGLSFTPYFFIYVLDSVGYIFYIFGGYYFTKLFFKTDLSPKEFFSILAYFMMPLLIFIPLFFFIPMYAYVLDPRSSIQLIAIPFFLVGFYYLFKELSTILYVFTREFETGEWKLASVVLIWSFIFGVISSVLSIFAGALL